MSTPHAAMQGSVYVRKLLRIQFKSQHVADGRPVASILRATVTAPGRPSAGVPPTTNLVTGLADLLVAIDYPSLYDSGSRPENPVILRENERIFTFLDLVPGSGPASIGFLSDFIEFQHKIWKCIQVENDVAIGTTRMKCELWRR